MIDLTKVKIVKTEDLQNYDITVKCPVCGKETTVRIPTQSLFLLHQGAYVQDACPDLTPEEREILCSGVCPDCWKLMFAIDEEEIANLN